MPFPLKIRRLFRAWLLRDWVGAEASTDSFRSNRQCRRPVLFVFSVERPSVECDFYQQPETSGDGTAARQIEQSSKFVPVIVTIVPTAPDAGVKEVITG